MFLTLFKKIVANIKEVHELGLFGIMSDEDLFFIFNGSPIFYVLLPILGILATIQAAIKGYELFKAQNKNFDQWFGFTVSAVCAALASISLYGTVAAAYFELNFALGPWFFLAGIGVAFTHQLTMMGLNLFRVFESPLNSSQHQHYMQAALNNLFNLALLTAIMGAVAFVMISPAAPALGAASALAVVGFTGVNILWRILPKDWKSNLKNLLGLGKPEYNQPMEPERNLELIDLKQSNQIPQSNYKNIFVKQDHSAIIAASNLDEGLAYLQKIINQKISAYNALPLPHTDKNKQKKALLTELCNALKDPLTFSKKNLLEHYPLAFQSFWAEKGEVEQITNAVELLVGKYAAGHNEMEMKFTGSSSFSI